MTAKILTLADLPPMSQEEKDWWNEHDFEYYHYLYRIDNIINGMFYYGIHSQRKDLGKEPENDGYMGSGTDLKRAQKEEGLDNFKKTVVKIFSTRDEARLEEMRIVTQELVDDKMCYNLTLGGGCVPSFLFTTKGLIAVNYRDEAKRKEKMFLITIEEYETDKDLYITASTGRVAVDFADGSKRTGKFFSISVEEYENNKDLYIVSSTGKSIYRSADGKDTKLLETDSPLVLSGEYVPIVKGIKQSPEVVAKKTGAGNGMYGKMWITNGTDSRIIGKDESIPDGFRPGRWNSHPRKSAEGGTLVINRFTKEKKRVCKKDISELEEDTWFTIGYFKDGEFITYEEIQEIFERTNSWTKVRSELNISRESLNKLRKYYEGKGQLFSSTAIIKKPREKGKWSSGMKDRVYIHNENEYRTIKKDCVKQYLSEGWKLGRK